MEVHSGWYKPKLVPSSQLAEQIFGFSYILLTATKYLLAFKQDVFSFNFHHVIGLVLDFGVHK
jgi:hypothetical protein